jgi:PKD repeat protein
MYNRRVKKHSLRAAILAAMGAGALTGTPAAEAAGLGTAGGQLFRQGAGGLIGAPEDQVDTQRGDQFGAEVEAGDFNCDGRADLAIGVPTEDQPSWWRREEAMGEVFILYGTGGGLASPGHQVLQQSPRRATEFGSALASGDFNGDDCDDLAVGAPVSEDGAIFSGESGGGGSVTLYHGSETGLSRYYEYDQNQGVLPGSVETDDEFGAALASGDFDNDGYADLAIGVPGEDDHEGGVIIMYGHPQGLITAGSTMWDQGNARVGTQESWDRFGASLAVADFNNDGHDDLAIGAPGEDDDAGAVVVMYGWREGIHPNYGPPGPNGEDQDARLFMQGRDGMIGRPEGNPGYPENSDAFGTALTTGDFNGDGFPDLAIGVPGEEIPGKCENDGVVQIIYGWATGLQPGNGPGTWDGRPTGNQIVQPAGCSQFFGSALDAADFDGDGIDELVVGVPERRVATHSFAGEVLVVPGTPAGPDIARAQGWTHGGTRTGRSEEYDFFGAALEAADFDGNGSPDLAIGVPGENDFEGAVTVLYGHGADQTGPEIIPIIPQSPSASGWYTTNVDVSWHVSDPESLVAFRDGCEPERVTIDTPGIRVFCSAGSGGGTSHASLLVRRDTLPPTLGASRTYVAAEGSTVRLDASAATDATSGIAGVRWEPDVGPALTGSVAELPVTDDGTIRVRFTVTDAAGLSTSGTTLVEVRNLAPEVHLTAPATPVGAGLPVRLVGGFTDPGTEDTHSITWDLGDGNTASGKLTLEHTWEAPGDYVVRLTVVDDDGGTGSAEAMVSVRHAHDIIGPPVTIGDPIDIGDPTQPQPAPKPPEEDPPQEEPEQPTFAPPKFELPKFELPRIPNPFGGWLF